MYLNGFAFGDSQKMTDVSIQGKYILQQCDLYTESLMSGRPRYDSEFMHKGAGEHQAPLCLAECRRISHVRGRRERLM
jgi:hypothetical protein